MSKVLFRAIQKTGRFLLRSGIERNRMAKAVWYGVVRPLLLRVYPQAVIAVLGGDEDFEAELFQASILVGDTVLDLGANVGHFTVLAAWRAGPAGRIFAFEPAPDTFRLLRQNVNGLRLSNVELIAKGVSQRSRPARLYFSSVSKGDHRTYDPEGARAGVPIELVALDEYFLAYDGVIDVIKMDIQGSEMGAVAGMRRLLRGNERVKLFTEFWPAGLAASGSSPEAYLKLLTDELGFHLYRIDEQDRCLELTTSEKLLCLYTVEQNNYTNLLCVRNRLDTTGDISSSRTLFRPPADRTCQLGL